MATEQQPGRAQAPAPSSPTSATPASDGAIAPGVSREYAKGAGYDEAAAALSPGANPQTKYEESLRPGAPAQAQQEAKEEPTHGGAKSRYGVEARDRGGERGRHYGYEKNDDGSVKRDEQGRAVRDRSAKEWGYIDGTGVGRGNRKADTEQWVDPDDKSKGKEVSGKKVSMSDITGIPAPDLSELDSSAKGDVKGPYGTSAGYNIQSGTKSGTSGKFEPKLENGELKGVEGQAYTVGGVKASGYAGIEGKKEGKYGSVEGKAKAEGAAYAGYDARAKIGPDGASATANVGLGVEAKVSADADYKTPGLKVKGVDTPLDVGVGVHGEASAWAKAGAGGGAYLTKDKVGLWGSAGAGAAAEAKGDIHGNIGPVGGTLEGSVMAGAAAGIEGGILYEDGKLTIGGRAYAALGYGGKVGGTITIDLKQSYQLGVAMLKKAKQVGIEGARRAFNAADADNDGKLSVQDAALHGKNAMEGGAKRFEKGLEGLKNIMDGDGDGKFDLRKDAGAYVDKGAKAIKDGAKSVYDGGKKMVDGAIKRGGEMLDAAHDAADMDGDGKLGLGDVKAAAQKAEERVHKGIEDAQKGFSDAKAKAAKWGNDRLADAQELAKKAHKAADRSGDGKLGMDDVAIAATELKDAAVKRGGEMIDAGKDALDAGMKKGGEMVDAAVKRGGELKDAAIKRGGEMIDSGKKAVKETAAAAHKALDRDGDGSLGLGDAKAAVQQAGDAIADKAQKAKAAIDRTYEATKTKVQETAKQVFDAADLNQDGKVDAADARILAQRKAAAARRLKAAAERRAAQLKKEAAAALKAAEDRARKAAADAKKALDRDGDGKLGLSDVAAGAHQAKDAVVKKATAVRDRAVAAASSARESLGRAADTLSEGYNNATTRASNAWNGFTSWVSGG